MVAVPKLLDEPPTMPNVWRRAVERFGDHELVVTEAGERVTYAHTDERSALLARRLLAAGVGKGTRVAMLLGQTPEWLSTYVALGRIGAVAVPISTFARPRELATTLRLADAALLVTSRVTVG